MNYLNYFSQCDKREQSFRSASFKKMIMFYGCIGIAFLVFYLFFLGKSYIHNSQLNYLQDIKTDPGFVEQYNISNEVATIIDNANKDYDVIIELQNVSEVLNTVNEKLFNLIIKCIGEDSKIKQFNISGKYITLIGVTEKISSITQIERNFREENKFSYVHVELIENLNQNEESEIVENEFTCNLTLKGALTE